MTTGYIVVAIISALCLAFAIFEPRRLEAKAQRRIADEKSRKARIVRDLLTHPGDVKRTPENEAIVLGCKIQVRRTMFGTTTCDVLTSDGFHVTAPWFEVDETYQEKVDKILAKFETWFALQPDEFVGAVLVDIPLSTKFGRK